MVERLCYIFID